MPNPAIWPLAASRVLLLSGVALRETNPTPQAGFHCGLDRLSGIKFHNYRRMFHLNAAALRSLRQPPVPEPFFSEDEWSFAEFVHLDLVTDPFVLRWNDHNNLIRHKRLLAKISIEEMDLN